MRKILFLLLLSCFFTVYAADKKIAIIGDSLEANQVADVALIELATSDSVAVLERTEIEKILKEQKLSASTLTADNFAQLSKISHVDVFAIINSAKQDKKTVLSSLLVFDAKTGFKLLDIRLNGSLDKNAKTVTEAVSSALKQMHDKQKITYVAVLSVRNGGVPSKYKYQLENIAEEVQRRLVAAPDVAVLERSRLGLVNKERKLSDTQYQLRPSVYLLDFEFIQGRSESEVNLNLHLTSANGKKFKSYEYKNCLKHKAHTIDMVIERLAKWLRKNLSMGVVSSTEEAKRYFHEAKMLPIIERAQKVQAAIALNPDNPEYLNQMLEIKFRTHMSKPQSFEANLKLAHEMLRESKEIRTRFPRFIYIFGRNGAALLPLWSYWRQHRSSMSSQVEQELQQLAKEYRDFYTSRNYLSEKYSRRGFTVDNPKSLYQVALYNYGWDEVSEGYFYFNDDECMHHSIVNKIKALKAYKQLRKDYPKGRKLPTFSFHRGFSRYHFTTQNYFTLMSNQLRSQEMQELITELQANWQPKMQEMGSVLAFMRSYVLNNHNAQQFATELDKLLPKIKNIYKANNLLKDFYSSPGAPAHLYQLLDKKIKKLTAKNSQQGDWPSIKSHLFQARSSEEKAQVIIDNQRHLQKWRKGVMIYLDSPMLSLWPIAKQLNPLLNHSIRNRKLCERALEVLNAPIKLSLVKDLSKHKNQIVKVREYNGMIYLLGVRPKVKISRFNPKDETLTEVFSTNKTILAKNYYYVREISDKSFFVNDNYFIIGEKKRIVVISRGSGDVNYIENLPGDYLHAFTLLNNRLYIFAGMEEARAGVMFSCDLYGENRQFHITTRKRANGSPLDENKMMISGVYPDSNQNRILFLCGRNTNNEGFWQMSVEKGEFKRLLSMPVTETPWSTIIGSKIYLTGSKFNSAFFICDLSNNSIEFSLLKSISRFRKKPEVKLKPRYKQNEMKPYTPPVYWKDYDLWGGHNLKYSDLRNSRKFWPIYGITRKDFRFYPHPDGRSVYVIGSKFIYRVFPPPEIKKKSK